MASLSQLTDLLLSETSQQEGPGHHDHPVCARLPPITSFDTAISAINPLRPPCFPLFTERLHAYRSISYHPERPQVVPIGHANLPINYPMYLEIPSSIRTVQSFDRNGQAFGSGGSYSHSTPISADYMTPGSPGSTKSEPTSKRPSNNKISDQRREQNRNASIRYRNKQSQRINDLETLFKAMSEENRLLGEQEAALRNEIEFARMVLEQCTSNPSHIMK